MKTRVLIVSLIAASVWMFNACDYVRNAVPESTGIVNTPGDTSDLDTGVVFRKVLIEDYTGHKCGNCPAAARELHKIDSTYAGRIVPLAVHAGFYATINTQYPTDLRSQAGTDWDAFFGISQVGNPNGLVNRMSYSSASNFIQPWTAWSGSAYSFLDDTADFSIKITNTYTISTNRLTTKIKCKLKRNLTGIYKLSVVLVEDSIIAEQIDYSLSGNQLVPDYEFEHVLRGAMNTSWGSVLFSGTKYKNDTIVETIPNYQLGSAWKYKDCKVVAFIYDADPASATYYEVKQVEAKDLW